MDGNNPFFWLGEKNMATVKAIKQYGQNFLKNPKVLEDISNLVDVNEEDLILEIGPGMGALTEYLAKKKCNLLCYEIDHRMEPFLKKYTHSKTVIIYDDFMKRDLKKDLLGFEFHTIYLVANIPYYITTPILLKLIRSDIPFQKIVLLVQKEFALRLTAKTGSKNYNDFTLYVHHFFNSKLMFIVNKENFSPVPKVDSAVILLERKQPTKIKDEEEYFEFIKQAFQNKRKTLKNNMKFYDWDKILKILNTMGYNEKVRAEEISPENFQKLWELYR